MLTGVRVMEVSSGASSTGVAAAFCARLFADHGADVVLVEPPGGTPLRSAGPSLPGRADSLLPLFWHLSTGKQSVAADLTDDAEVLLGLGERCHLLVTDLGEVADRLAAPLARHGGHVCLVTDFSRAGPWADWLGDEIVHQALGGAMFMTGAADAPPLYGFGERAGYAAGVAAYIASLAALLGAERGAASFGPPSGAALRVSVHEVMASMAQNLTSQYRYSGAIERRGANRRPSARIRASDGWLVLFVMPGNWQPLCAAIGRPDLAADQRFARYPDLVTNWPQARAELEQVAASWRAADLAAALAKAGLAARAVATPTELLDDADLIARSFWQHAEEPGKLGRPLAGGGGGLVVGPIARFSGWRRQPRPAPQLDEHRDRVLALLATAPLPLKTMTRAAPQPPLHGLRVLDLTSAWSGPMATRILAHLGATVVKVEAPRRMDGWRGQLEPSDPWMYPGREPGERPYNRNVWFNTQNRGKRAISLDLQHPAGRLAGQALALTSDVVIANGKPGMLGRLGLDRSVLTTQAPGLVTAELPAYGSDCPSADHRALGPTMEAATGFTYFIGYRDGPPIGSGPAYLDPMGALHGTAAILTALYHRHRTGRGIAVEVAQREAAMQWLGEWLLDAAATGHDRPRMGNAHPSRCPHGAYRCAGADNWIAISVHRDGDWLALAAAMGRPDLAADRDLASRAGRHAREAEIDAAISGWTANCDKWQLTRVLQAAGVRAGAVSDARDLADDADLRASGFFAVQHHPEAGTYEYPGLPFHDFPPAEAADLPAPCFGADTRCVLRDWAGMSDAEIDALFTAGACSDQPVAG